MKNKNLKRKATALILAFFMMFSAIPQSILSANASVYAAAASAITVEESEEADESGDAEESDESSEEISSGASESGDSTGESSEDSDEDTGSAEDVVSLTEEADVSAADDAIDSVTAEYILENASEEYTGCDFFEMVNVLVVKQMIVDGSLAGDAETIDEFYELDDWAEAFITQITTATAVYDLSNDSDYVVSYADTLFSDSSYTASDAVFALYNYEGELVDGCVYDEETGLVYIPKEAYYGEDGSFEVGRIQVQFLQQSNESDLTEMDAQVQAVVEEDGSVQTGEGDVSVFDFTTTVEAPVGVDEDRLIVAVNGIPVDEFTYDAVNGTVTVQCSSAAAQSVSVTVEDETVAEKILSSISALTAFASTVTYGSNSLTTISDNSIVFQTTPSAGDSFTDEMYFRYGSASANEEYETADVSAYCLTSNTSSNWASYVSYIESNTNYTNLENFSYSSTSGNRTFLIYLRGTVEDEDTGSTIDFSDINLKTLMACSHISTSLGTATGIKNHWGNITVLIRVLQVDTDSKTVVLGFLTQKVTTQTGYGIIAFNYETEEASEAVGYINVKKVAVDSEYNTLTSYSSLAGAVFTVYEDEDCTTVATTATGKKAYIYVNRANGTGTRIKMAAVDGNGDGVIDPDDDDDWDANTYYIRETTGPDGYLISTYTYEVNLFQADVNESASTDDLTVYNTAWVDDTNDDDDDILENYDGYVPEFEFLFPFTISKSSTYNSYDYPFDGVVYTVYNDYEEDDDGNACSDSDGNPTFSSSSVVGTIEYDEDENAFTTLSLSSGIYYVKETSTNKYYELDSTVYMIEVSMTILSSYTSYGTYNIAGSATYKFTFSARPVSVKSGELNMALTSEYPEFYENLVVYGKTDDGYEDCSDYYLGKSAYAKLFIIEFHDPASIRFWEYNSDTEWDADNDIIVEGLSLSLSLYDEPAAGYLDIAKSSADEDITDGNSMYNLAGAVYTVYTDSSCTTQATDINGNKASFTIDSDGNSDTLTMIAGTYYIKETSAPSNGSYELDETVYTAVVSSSARTTVDSVDTAAVVGTFTLHKYDSDRGSSSSDPQGNASLESAQYTVKYYDAQYSSASSVSSSYLTNTWVFETDSDGDIDFSDSSYFVSGDDLYYDDDNNIVYPLGTYVVYETDPSTGYAVEGTTHIVNITSSLTSSGESSVSVSVDGGSSSEIYITSAEDVIRGGISIQKYDEDGSTDTPQGDASISGAVYSITNNSSYSVYVDGAWYAKGAVVATLTTDESGYAATSSTLLPYGSYIVQETTAPEGYDLSNTKYTVSITEQGVIVEAGETVSGETAAVETVKRGGLTVYKYDAETGLNEEQGGADFVGTVLAVTNSSEEAVYVPKSAVETSSYIEYDPEGDGEDGWFDVGDVIMYIIVQETDEGIFATTDGNLDGECETLPYGTYTITEVDTDVEKGYYMGTDDTNSSDIMTVAVLNDGTDGEDEFEDGQIIVCAQDNDSDGIYDQVLRGDFYFTKTDEDGIPFAGILWRLDQYDKDGNVVDYHYLVTDENGYFTSSWDYASHTAENANKNDDAVTYDEETDTYTVDESLLSSAYGVWFGTDEADESEGALPYGMYRLTEIETSANAGYSMRSFTFNITQADGTHGEDVAIELSVKNLGTIQNLPGTEPAVATTVTNETTESQFASATEGNYIVDTVTLYSTDEDTVYTVTAKLVNSKTGLLFEDADGNTYETTLTVAGTGNDITKKIEFDDVNLTGMEGESIVVFVYVYDENGTLVGSDDDPSNRDETIYVADVSTEALDAENGLHISDSRDSVQITDTVSYSNVAWGKDYTIIGVLYNAETGEPLYDEDGELVTAKTSFTANTSGGAIRTYDPDGSVAVAYGTAEITFTLNSEDLDGVTVVAYEYLYYQGGSYTGADGVSNSVGKILAWEEDIDNEDQTIHIPAVSTTASDTATGDSVGVAVTETGILDTVAYENVVIGYTYKLEATVIDYADGEELSYTGSATFTATSTEGTVNVSIADVSADQGDTYVVYEVLYVMGTDDEWHVVCNHEEIEDEEETIHYPDLETLAFDINTFDDVGTVESSATIVDTVSFSNVVVGMQYTVTGTLYDRETGEILTIDGSTFTASTTFIVNTDGTIAASNEEEGTVTEIDDDGYAASGTVTVTFSGIDSEQISGDSVVVYETLSHNSVDVAEHTDIADDNQTVHYPFIDTEAYDYYTGDHVGTVWGNLVSGIRSLLGFEDADADGVADVVQNNLIDSVTLENLVPGRTYTLTGVLYDSSTEEAYEQDGGKITATVTFTVAEDGSKLTLNSGLADSLAVDNYDETNNSVDATVQLAFSIDTSQLEGSTIVVYESLYHNDVEVVSHTEIDDEDQSLHYPYLETHAADSKTLDHVGTSSETAEIIDEVHLTNLIVGQEYTVTGYPVYQENYTDSDGVEHEAGDVIEYDEDASTDSVTFTATAAEMTVTLTYVIDSTLLEGTTAVVYEDLEHKGVVVNTHHDIESEEQSVYYPKVGTNAIDEDTADDVGAYTEAGTIIDTVTLTNLLAGNTYVLKGFLMDQDTGDYLDADGETYSKEITIVVNEDGTITLSDDNETCEVTSYDEESGSVDATVTMTFTGIDTTVLSDHTAVVFEYLYHEHEDCGDECWMTEEDDGAGEILVADHTEILDIVQSVHYPSVSTLAYDYYTGDHVGTVWGNLVSGIRSLLGFEDTDGDGIADAVQENLLDTVALTNLIPGRTYTLYGILMDEESGEEMIVNGEAVTKTYTFTVSSDGTSLTFTGETPDEWEITETDTDRNRVSCTITVPFSIDTSQTAGWTATVYEYLYHNDVLVGEHTDIDDADQQVSYIEVKTHAVDSETLDHVGTSSEAATIIDTVNLQNLVVGQEYTVTGTLHYKEDFTDANGTEHSAGDEVEFDKDLSEYTVTFTADAEELEIDLTYVIDSSLLEGTTVVVFESVCHNDTEIIKHNDIESEEQSVYYPAVGTNAIDEDTADDVGAYTEDGTIVDTVSLTNLLAGNTYVVKGYLMDQDTGELLDADGETFSREVTVTVNKDGTITLGDENETSEVLSYDEETGAVDGTVTITFTGIDTTVLSDHTAVVFEYLYHTHEDCETGECWMTKTDDDAEEVLIAEHTELLDEAQSVHYPSMDTVAIDYYTQDHVGTVWGDLLNNIRSLLGYDDDDDSGTADVVENNLVETVSMTNLVPGRTYTITGTLVNNITGEEIVLNDSAMVETYTFTVSEDGTALTFTGEEPDEYETSNIDLERNRADAELTFSFSIDSSQMAGKTAVVFEVLTHNGVTVAELKDKDDADESVNYPEIKTHAADSKTLDHVGTSSETAEIIDTVKLDNLVVGEEYTVTGYPVYQEDYLDADGVQHYAGDEIAFDEDASTYEVTFTATSESMTVELTYVVDSTLLEGTTAVVYEDLFHNGVNVISHHDIESEEQSVYYPEIHTSAADDATTDDVGAYTTDETVVDTVSFTNLLAGMTYTVKGTFYNQETGTVLYVNGEEVTAETTLTINEDGTATCSDGETIVVTSFDEDNGSADGTVTVTFTGIDTTDLSGMTAVIYERLYHTHEDCDDCWMTQEDDDAEEILVADHTEILDKVQSIHYPALETTAVDSDTGTHVGSIWGALTNGVKTLLGYTDADGNGIDDDKQQTVIDTVALYNLVPGRTYTVTGVLYDQGTGEALLINGEEITQTATFTVAEDGSGMELVSGSAEKLIVTEYDADKNYVNGTIDLVFTFDSSLLDNEPTTIVVFEDLYHNDVLAGIHEDIEDESQSVNEISVTSAAADGDTGDQVGKVSGYETTDEEGNAVSTVSTIVDTVYMEKLVYGETYTIVGYLIDQNSSTEEELVYLTNEDGSEVSATVTFTATEDDEVLIFGETDGFSASGSAELTFTFENELVQGKAITVVAQVYYGNVLIAVHGYSLDEDGNFVIDADESVYYPTGKTNATDVDTETHTSDSDAGTVITDLVYFQNLLVGEEYTITGTLYYQEDFTDANGVSHSAGDPVTESHEWEEVQTTVYACLCGETFETEADADAHVTEYEGDDSHEIYETEETIYYCADCDSYSESGENAAYTSSVTFTAAEEIENAVDVVVTTLADGTQVVSGYMPVTFTVDTSDLAGATIVVFEDFIHKGVTIFTHADLEDAPQMIKIPAISTNAYVGDLDEADVYNEDGSYATVVITDTVSYENLWTSEELIQMHEEGLTIESSSGAQIEDLRNGEVYDIEEEAVYTLVATLMVKETREALTDSEGNAVTVTKTFTVEADEDGTVDVEFTLDLNDFLDEDGECYLEGITLVAFETLYIGGTPSDENKIGEHEDIDDYEQDIRFPEGRTHANDIVASDADDDCVESEEGHEHEVYATTDVQIIDKVSYENLHGGTTYYISGTLVDKDTGEAVTDDNGDVITSTVVCDAEGNVLSTDGSFTTEGEYNDEVDGYVYILFSFSGEILAGKTVVAFETVSREGQTVITHADISDAAQTIHFPEIRTTAGYVYDGESLEDFHLALADDEITLYDVVAYENLKAGEIYTISGVLYDKETGEALLNADGTEVTAQATFVVNEDGSATVIDAVTETEEEIEESDALTAESIAEAVSILQEQGYEDIFYIVTVGTDDIPAGKYVLTDDGYVLDEDEDGYVYDISDSFITAVYGVSVSEVIYTVAEGTDDIPAGTYTKTDEGYLLQGDESGTVYQIPDELITGAKSAAKSAVVMIAEPEAENEDYAGVSGTIELAFTFDASLLAGHTLVAYETLTAGSGTGGKTIADHKDIEDEDQSVHIPLIETSAIDANSTIQSGVVSEETTVTDTVTYTNLIAGKTYTVKGTLYDQETGEILVDADGNEVTAETEFTAEEADGSVQLSFTFNTSLLAGTTVVAFEEIYYKDVLIGIHAEIDDEAQAVYFPAVSTSALDPDTDAKSGSYGEEVTIIDIVSYENLIPGTTYTVSGILMNKDTGEALTVDGETVVSEAEFTPEESDGTVEVEFTLDSTSLSGISAVIFENLYYKDTLLASDADIENDDETVYYPVISTSAVAGNTGTRIGDAEKTTIIDTVEYKNLVAGLTYTVSGVLMDKDTGEELVIDGNTVTAETEFTAESAEGSVELVYEIDATDLDGVSAVVFEDLYTNSCLVAQHHDIDDAAQTVYFKSEVIPTGDMDLSLWFSMIGAAAFCIAAAAYRKKKDLRTL